MRRITALHWRVKRVSTPETCIKYRISILLTLFPNSGLFKTGGRIAFRHAQKGAKEAIKYLKFSEEQTAYVSRPAESGTPVVDLCS